MPARLVIYYLLLLGAAVAVFTRSKKDSTLTWVAAVFFVSLAEELYFEYRVLATGKQLFIIYHLYIPVYYGLFAWYFYLNLASRNIRRIILFSVVLFPVLSYGMSLHSGFSGFPGMQINTAGILLIAWSLLALLTMDYRDATPFHRRTVYWISFATFVFYCSDFAVIGLKNYLSAHNRDLSQTLNKLINVSLNYLYYLLIIIGMICSVPPKKSSSLSS